MPSFVTPTCPRREFYAELLRCEDPGVSLAANQRPSPGARDQWEAGKVISDIIDGVNYQLGRDKLLENGRKWHRADTRMLSSLRPDIPVWASQVMTTNAAVTISQQRRAISVTLTLSWRLGQIDIMHIQHTGRGPGAQTSLSACHPPCHEAGAVRTRDTVTRAPGTEYWREIKLDVFCSADTDNLYGSLKVIPVNICAGCCIH